VLLFRIVTQGIADVGVPYSQIEETYERTLGVPFHLFQVFPDLQSSLPQWLIGSYLGFLTVPGGLLLLSGAVVLADRSLARTRFAVRRNARPYLSALVGASLGALLFLIWPLPSRHPQMPDIPIPDNAVAVRYTRGSYPDTGPMTTFVAANGTTTEQMLDYYHRALEANGWRLEWGEGYQYYAPSSGHALFSKGDTVVALDIPGNIYGLSVRITMRKVTPAELADIRKPTATSAPPAVPTFGPIPTLGPAQP
jgi:hypothetical protein